MTAEITKKEIHLQEMSECSVISEKVIQLVDVYSYDNRF